MSRTVDHRTRHDVPDSRLTTMLDRLRRGLDGRASLARAAWPMAIVVLVGLASVPFVGSRGLAAGALLAVAVGSLLVPTSVVALVWGLTLPIEVVRGVPSWGLDILRFTLAAVLVVRVAPSARVRSAPWNRWAILLGGLALVRAAMAAVNHSNSGVRVGLVMLSGLVAALLVLLRYPLHRPVLLGFVGGVFVSAVVVLMQVAGVPTLHDGVADELRYPGLSTQTSTVTWQLAMAVVVTGCLLIRAPRSEDGTSPTAPVWLAYPVIVVCSVALLVCGAQGGMLGIVVAAAVVGPAAIRSLSRSQLRVAAAAAVVVLLVAVTAAVTLQVDGIPPEKGFVNESTRWEVAGAGLRTLVDHPVTGVAAATFRAEHDVLPHTVPIESGVVAGVLAFGLALAIMGELLRLVVRGRRSTEGLALLGAAMAAVIVTNTLVEAGTFIGLGRITVVLLAVAAGSALDLGARTGPPGGGGDGGRSEPSEPT